MSRFVLPIVGYIDHLKNNDDFEIIVETRGLLSTMGGCHLIIHLLGNDCIVDVGSWMKPFVFKCKIKDLESLRQLLEDELQHGDFDCFQSKLFIRT